MKQGNRSTVNYFYHCLISLLLPLSGLLASQPVSAHETPIALLTLSEFQSGRFFIEWNYSSANAAPPPVAEFPKHCRQHSGVLNCGTGGLHGTISLAQTDERYSAVVVQIKRNNERQQTYTLTGTHSAVILTADRILPLSQVIATYIPLGFEHILLGVDHLLFVLGLMWLVNSTRMLLHTITAFTVAHSVTLAAVTLGWIGVEEKPVNAAIALSIAIIAVEVVKYRQGKPSLSARFPWLIALAFGLLHGFGFSGALTSIGLSPENLPAALLFFNIGVELGQLCFVFLILALIWAHRNLQVRFPSWSTTAVFYAIGTIGAYWFYSRLDILINSA